LKSPTSSFFFVLSKYFDNRNYDPYPIMGTVADAGCVPRRADGPAVAHLISALYT
jgi:hypothetical protein